MGIAPASPTAATSPTSTGTPTTSTNAPTTTTTTTTSPLHGGGTTSTVGFTTPKRPKRDAAADGPPKTQAKSHGVAGSSLHPGLDNEYLIPRAVEIFTDWFYRFAGSDGQMTREGAARFINSCVHDGCQASDNRVDRYFANFDRNGDDSLTVDDFLVLYSVAVKDQPEVVWSNLAVYGYHNDLNTDEDDYQQWCVTLTSPDPREKYRMPRYILSQDGDHFERLMKMLHTASWAVQTGEGLERTGRYPLLGPGADAIRPGHRKQGPDERHAQANWAERYKTLR